MAWFYGLSPIVQALIATCGTWLVTALGAALVLLVKRVSQKYLDASLGVAAGVMIAASFWSLLAPAIEMAAKSHGETWKWFPPMVGFLLGAVVLLAAVLAALQVVPLAFGYRLARPWAADAP